MTRLTWLADELRAAGLTVVEHPGWQTHAVSGTWAPTFGVVHATAAPARQADDVQVSVVRDGRQGLPGPIANCVVDRQGRWHVVAAGRCNTTLPGTAGPFKGMGNTYALGVEGCNDNAGEPWPVPQYTAYVRGWAAICRRLGWTAEDLVGHREHTPGHKTDPTFDMGKFRADVAAVLDKGDDDMSFEDDQVPVSGPGTTATNTKWTGPNALGDARDRIARTEVKVDKLLALVTQLAGKDLVDEAAIVAGVLAGLAPEAIAAAIPTDLAAQVVDELTRRMAA